VESGSSTSRWDAKRGIWAPAVEAVPKGSSLVSTGRGWLASRVTWQVLQKSLPEVAATSLRWVPLTRSCATAVQKVELRVPKIHLKLEAVTAKSTAPASAWDPGGQFNSTRAAVLETAISQARRPLGKRHADHAF